MTSIRNAWRRFIGQLAPAVPGARRRKRRYAGLDALGPATRYAARAGAYSPLCDQSTVIFDSRPLMTPLARQRSCSR
ncbi:hypothetical protein [Salinispora mooreana]|uniref:hypothetical protein n=1 Tax=Salinispora mooreana TaxID=999545 RepID=UPI000477E630|nr:hypothetical protein [Salinispora mooreana]